MNDRRCVFGIALLSALLFVAAALPANAQQTVGLFLNDDDAYDGYTLFAPQSYEITYLINNEGRYVHSWPSTYGPGFSAYLLDNGDLLRTAIGGGVQRIAWDGTLLWEYFYVGPTFQAHHDVEALPNGNVLIIAWESKTPLEAIQAGRDPANLGSEFRLPHIVEVQPNGVTGGTIVWEWHLWDHLVQDFDPTKANFGVVGDNPQLMDINAHGGIPDWIHLNSVDYNPAFDQIMVAGVLVGEIWVIDHSTTTAQASGHTGGSSGKGGDLLYRWGNPQNYDRGAPADRVFYVHHDARWIEPGSPGAGNITIFNNGSRPEGNYSSVEEIVPPVDGNGSYTLAPGAAYGPSAPTWSYVGSPPTSFYAWFMSGAHRLPNGNTLILHGPRNEMFEVKPTGETVWKYVNPVSSQGPVPQGAFNLDTLFRIHRYPPSHPAFVGRDLTPGNPLEIFNNPQPVPDGSAGTLPMTCTRANLQGERIDCTWDTGGIGTCPTWDYNLIYGDLGSVASYSLLGSECAIGISGSHSWTGVPAGDLFFLIVGVDDTGIYETSWGLDGAGAQRNGTAPSNFCGVTTKDTSGACP